MTIKKPGTDLPIEKKYGMYESTVQNVESDVDFIEKEYEKLIKRPARDLREDFGGTGALACEWVKRGKIRRAWAIDLDSEPINYGHKHHFSKLSEDEKERMSYLESNVLDEFSFTADIVVAFNFSYFIFKKRQQLLEYFTKVRNSLNDDGAFFIDLFGGTECRQELEEETEFDEYSYYWDCDEYNVINDDVTYYIHFKEHKSDVKYERVFTYNWRMWGLAELQDILRDAGFSQVIPYWEEDEEDDDEDGGNGVFYPSQKEDNCESWVTYIVALK